MIGGDPRIQLAFAREFTSLDHAGRRMDERRTHWKLAVVVALLVAGLLTLMVANTPAREPRTSTSPAASPGVG